MSSPNGNSGWKTVVNPKKETALRWKKLVEEHPHIITPKRAYIIQREINIDGLVASFASSEWINVQCDGWTYVKTIRDGKELPFPEGIAAEDGHVYCYLIINNKWKDKAMFRKVF